MGSTGEPPQRDAGRAAAPVLVGLRVSPDSSVSIHYTGAGFAALFDREPSDTPRTVADALCTSSGDERSLLDSVRASARSGSPWHFTWRVHHAAGREVDFEAVALPVDSDDGTTLHGYVREVPRQEPLDAGLASGAGDFRSIVEASPVPYAMNDEHQNITYVNPAFVAAFGYSRDDIPTLEVWWPKAYPDPEYRRSVTNDWVTRLERAKQTGTPFEPVEVRIQAKDGTQRIAVVGALSLESSFRGVHVVVLQDITERKRAEEARLSLERQVQHSQKLESLGVLAGGIAHDFNNLLMAILGNADVALANLPAGSLARASIEAIEAAARRASEVANQMLAYSGKGKFVVAPLALSELVAEMSQLLRVAISKKVVLRCSFAEGLPSFDGDATQVRQVVMNLITNASEAIGDQTGQIQLTTSAMVCDRAYLDGRAIVRDRLHGAPLREGRYVFLEVADTGCGMTPETIERIFEPFFTTKFTGRGLGLSALLGIVHGHSGAIEIRSEVGAGTTIRVLFPMNVATDAVSSTVVRNPTPEPGSKGLILFVDDEEAIRTVVQQMLENLGFDVLLASNGQDAIELFRERQHEIAAVIVDLTMPILDGEQTFRQLRLIRPDAKVILSSGYSNLKVSPRFANGGLAGFLKKPFDMHELEGLLADALDVRRPTSGS